MEASAGELLCFYLPDPEQVVHHCPLPLLCPKSTPRCSMHPVHSSGKIQHKHTPFKGETEAQGSCPISEDT